MCGEGRHFKSKIMKFDVPRLTLEALYKIPFIGLMYWRGKLEEPIIAVVEAGTPEMPECVCAEITSRPCRADHTSVHGIKSHCTFSQIFLS